MIDLRLRIEYFLDPEARNWNFRVPALAIIGGGCKDRQEAERHALEAIQQALAEEGTASADLEVEAVYLDLKVAG
jgi:hypothetical protein